MRIAMRLRLWVSVLAMTGVLLHAGFLVRHSVAMAEAALVHHAIFADLSSLCRASTGEERVPASDLPALPQPSDTTGCPICSGLVSTFAVTGPQAAALPKATAAAPRHFAVAVAAAQRPRNTHPPARGPPAHT
jgi:hypothetical protein